MKVIDFDNREHNLIFEKYIVYNNDIRKRSLFHLQVRELLQMLFPLTTICEEMVLPGSGNLKLDFFLPDLRLAVECHGEQHYKFVPHFHGTKLKFLESCKRDRKKIEWCRINNIPVCELPYNESREQWTNRIESRGAV